MSNADIVNEWFRSRLTSGPLGRSTEAHNQVVDALPALIAELDAAAKPANPVRASVAADKTAKAAKSPTDAAAPVDPNTTSAKPETA